MCKELSRKGLGHQNSPKALYNRVFGSKSKFESFEAKGMVYQGADPSGNVFVGVLGDDGEDAPEPACGSQCC